MKKLITSEEKVEIYLKGFVTGRLPTNDLNIGLFPITIIFA